MCWVEQGTAHTRHAARSPLTHGNFPLSRGMPGPCCSRHPTDPAQETANKGQPQIFQAKHGTCSMHTTHFQAISPKFSSGMGFIHPFTAQAACSPGGCEKAAGGSQQHPLGSKCPRPLWAVLMCIAAASPGPGDYLILPSFRMDTYINTGKRRKPWSVSEAKTTSACLASSPAF